MSLAAIDTSSTSFHTGQLVGLVILVVIGIAVLMSAKLRGSTKTIILMIVMLLLTWNASKLIGSKSTKTWTSAQGESVRRDFIAGCSSTSGSVSYCECLFNRLSSVPPYNTPSGFDGLEASLRRAVRTADVNALPPAMVNAARACRA
jgi:hypothetical protein